MFTKAQLLTTTTVYRLGQPFKTPAVVMDTTELCWEQVDELPFPFSIVQDQVHIRYLLQPEDKVFGLGEQLGGLNRRGRQYRLYNTDEVFHVPEKIALYSSHPFIIIEGATLLGLLIDYPGEIILDIDFTERDVLILTITAPHFDLYVFQPSTTQKRLAQRYRLIQDYLHLVGAPYVPPKWAFGYQQCRWSYPDAETLKHIATQLRQHDIPCDVLYMDIDYMENYKVFTVDAQKFPEFEHFAAQLWQEGFKLVSIIDPGVKIEAGYSVYESGLAQQHFCLKADGEPFVGAAWPGLVHYPDFLNTATQNWWGQLHQPLLHAGIAGIWNDMNEPSIFFTEEALQQAMATVAAGTTIHNSWDYFALRDNFCGLEHHPQYYQSFYQRDPQGQLIPHQAVHNLYGLNMAQATLKAFAPNQRYFLLTRSSYIGSHRLAALWTGDNKSWWEHLLLNIKMLMSLNLCGFFYVGADIGGFGDHVSPELAIRWHQLGIFNPLFRNHSALGTRAQEPFAFDAQTCLAIKNSIECRYALLPYIYSEYMHCVQALTPFIAPLWLHFDTERSAEVEDQFFLGQALMVAPIYNAQSRGRYVYLPTTRWLHWNMSTYEQRQCQVYAPGDYYVRAPLEAIPLFIPENQLIMLTTPQHYIDERPLETLIILGLVTEKATVIYYHDDGVTLDYQQGLFSTLTVTVEQREGDYQVDYQLESCEQVAMTVEQVYCELYDAEGNMTRKHLSLDH